MNQIEIEKAKEEIINGIKEYNASYQDEEIRPCTECGGCLHGDVEIWECSNCDYSEED